MISFGPFPIQAVVVMVVVVLAWWVARAMAKGFGAGAPHQAAGGMVFDAFFWGMLAARLGHIGQWWRDYAAAPMSVFAIGDGGFLWWVGVLAATGFIGWRTRARPMLRRPVLAGVLAGVVVWLAAGAVLDRWQHGGSPLPAIHLTALDGQPVALDAYRGRPVVLNLWASWCPPCRREMPVFEQAQTLFPDIAFVMANQGETAHQIRAFLAQRGLVLSDVLMDPLSEAMRAVGSRGLPTTLFFDAQGRLVDSHMGELTMASLKRTVSRRFSPSPHHTQDKE